MRPTTKHPNQQTIMMADFTGGLNTSLSDDMIAQNQLSEMVNLEISNTGKLRTVYGTRDVVQCDFEADIRAAAWDNINNVLLLFCKDGAAYVYDILSEPKLYSIGSLSGDQEVITVNWEDGMLVASGGYLQYGKFVVSQGDGVTDEIREYKLTTITTSPVNCNGVYVRSGRVFVFDNQDNLLYSAVGDEESWNQNSNDPSAAIFTQIGYKVGGRILGLVNMQSYVLIIKDNGKIYRLDNEYPDWAIKEVTSSGMCKGRAAYASVGSNVFILGEKTLQSISPTDDYGNMPMNYVGQQVDNEIASLPPKTKMRFNTDLNQLWFVTNSQWVLIFDCNTKAFFQRYFNSDVVDLVGNLVIKRDKVSELYFDESEMQDEGKPLEYRARMKTDMTMHDLLVKRVDLSFLPLADYYENAAAHFAIGRIIVPFPDRAQTERKIRQRTVGVTNTALEPPYSQIDGEWDDEAQRWIKDDSQDVFLSRENVERGKSLHYIKRQIYKNHMIGITLTGSGFPFILNFISYDRAEV